MGKQLVNYLGVLGIGFGLAMWWLYVGRTGGNNSTQQRAGDTSRPAETAVGKAPSIDWGALQESFTIARVRVETKTLSKGGPFQVVSFEVQSREDFRGGSIYMAKFYDKDGIELGPVTGRDGVSRPRTMGLVTLEPDYALQAPFQWERGVRSRGWFMLPDDPDRPDLPRLNKVVITYFRP